MGLTLVKFDLDFLDDDEIYEDIFFSQVLKEQLSKSMVCLVKSGRVSVTSVDKGDSVMVVWNEDHRWDTLTIWLKGPI